ncbi:MULTISPECIES: RNA polymerase sigma factor RpoD/SigA [unclassified Streptomyces]|uniref:sigma-70 family RNA polymerase sigma factor n=1 Tax=unclassified Streptomyces TaxID=2593676 RepID=UPI001E4E149D|nr:sigma-70 family RNA polymerase sigma factor [Streptomyces sp. CB02980]MCB8905776.1 sigma-70 family RNA polymerase sigma factor [Streptomyces sp. CB02980]
MIERLRRCASRGGVITQRSFVKEAERLGLTTDEQRRRLRTGLAGVGLRVKPRTREVDVPGQPSAGRILTPGPGPIASEAAWRLALARKMLGRYADADGRVSRLAHDGVVRLHGLGPAEARELSVDFPINRPRPIGAAAGPGQAAEARKKPMGPGMSAGDSSLWEAVQAARVVLEEDRWLRDPKTRLLKAEEEVGLAVLLRCGVGDLARDIPKEEIAALSYGSDEWRAHESLVLHNVRLVWKVAQSYQGRGLDIEDLVQHGSIGLMRAVRKFDATKGYKLSTYATQWIRQHITRAIADEGTLIRLPVQVHEKVSKVARAERKLLNEGRPRTIENVAYATGFTFADVEEARRISRPTDSLHRIIGDDTALGDLIIGPSRLPDPCTVLLRKEFFETVEEVLVCFTEREFHILVRRSGLDGGEPATLEELGGVFKVTRERIRQIESKAKPVFKQRLIQRGVIPRRP